MDKAYSDSPYIGRTPFICCQKDQRFSYCMYVPSAYYGTDQQDYTLLTIIHGSLRTAEGYRDAFIDFADKHNCIVLVPLFPIGILGVDDKHSYKYIRHAELNYDQVLHDMEDEVRARFKRLRPKMLMHGFSGGGQFAHRYLYLNPNKLIAVSVGAPGTVSQLDPSLKWWPGTANFKELFGHEPNLKAMRGVNIQLIIGENDTETRDVTVSEFSKTWTVGANDAGINRRDRLSTLNNNITDHGMRPEITIVPDVAHEGMRILDEVKAFFSRVLS
ncbi:MAG: hypothetical protein JKY57_01405 [Kordiimonadaceae bacterium]|nr:hypothetical protein [Kordiimonadaceae bacterium]